MWNISRVKVNCQVLTQFKANIWAAQDTVAIQMKNYDFGENVKMKKTTDNAL